MHNLENLKKITIRYINGSINSLNKSIGVKELHLSGLTHDFFDIALYEYFLHEKIEVSKQYYYLTGIVSNILVLRFNKEIRINSVTGILLSDNIELINDFSYLVHSKQCRRDTVCEVGEIHLINSIQAVLRNDYSLLRKELKLIIDTKIKAFIPDIEFFMGILEKDKIKIEKSIITLVTKKHIYRNKYNVVIRDYISVPGLTYAKLAWLKGIEVEIDSPLVPKALLPIKPNKEYWEYDFMKLPEFRYK